MDGTDASIGSINTSTFSTHHHTSTTSASAAAEKESLLDQSGAIISQQQQQQLNGSSNNNNRVDTNISPPPSPQDKSPSPSAVHHQQQQLSQNQSQNQSQEILNEALPMHLLRPIILPTMPLMVSGVAAAASGNNNTRGNQQQQQALQSPVARGGNCASRATSPTTSYPSTNGRPTASGSAVVSPFSMANSPPSPSQITCYYQILRAHPIVTYKFVLDCARRCSGSGSSRDYHSSRIASPQRMDTFQRRSPTASRYHHRHASPYTSVENGTDDGSSVGGSPSSVASSPSQQQQHTYPAPSQQQKASHSSSLSSAQPRIDLLLRIFKYFLNVHVFSIVEPDIFFLMELDQFIHSGVPQKHISLKKYLAKLNAQIRICVEKKSPRDRELWKKYLESIGVEENSELWDERIITMKDVDKRRSITMRHPDLVFGGAPESVLRRESNYHLEKRRQLVKDFCDFRWRISACRGRPPLATAGDESDSHQGSSAAAAAIGGEPGHHGSAGGNLDSSLSANTTRSNASNSSQNDASLKAFVTRKRSLLDSLHFGAQFRQMAKFEDKMPEIDMSESLMVENVNTIYRHISGVAEAKQSEDSDNESDLSSDDFDVSELESVSAPKGVGASSAGVFSPTALASPDRGGDAGLNHSRVFEKVPLEHSISFDDVDSTLDVLVDPNADLHHYMQATHQILHLLSEVFWNYNLSEMNATQFFFIEMLQSESEKIRSHAFDLLYNLYLHIKSNSSPNSLTKYIPHLSEFLRNMCLYILLDDESHDEVWKAAHSCFVELVEPHYAEVIQFNVRVIQRFIELHAFNDENEHRHLVRILTNLLYFSKMSGHALPENGPPAGAATLSTGFHQRYNSSSLPVVPNPPAELNLFLLSELGGIEFILKQYVESHSFEVRSNLFTIIFDYVIYKVHTLKSRRVFKRDHIESLFRILIRADAPQYLPQLFCYTPDEFATQFAKFIYANLVLVQSTHHSASHRRGATSSSSSSSRKNHHQQFVDYKHLGESRSFMSLIIRFSVQLSRLSTNFLTLQDEFYPMYQQIMEQSNSEQEDIDLFLQHLTDLLKSSDDTEYQNGCSLLCLMMQRFDSLGDTLNNHNLHRQLEQRFQSMAHDKSERLRLVYLQCFQRMIYYHRSKYKTHGDQRQHHHLMKYLNEGLLRFVSRKRQPSRLLLRAFYILMDFISIYYTPPGNLAHPLQNDIPFIMNPASKRESDMDTIPCMFLGGHVAIPYFLLKDISIGILHNMFLCMTESLVMENMSSTLERSVERARCVLFVLMIQKCSRKPSVLSSLGGVSFFKNEMLNDHNPGVAYFAAEYLIRVLVRESKEEYYQFLRKIIKRAHKSNDAHLLDNPYLQLFQLVTEGKRM